MDEQEINERIDLIQADMEKASAEVRNALHACRAGHPLGNGQDRTDLFRNAAFALSGRVSSNHLIWLNKVANQFHGERALTGKEPS
jgi:hypothetical protein